MIVCLKKFVIIKNNIILCIKCNLISNVLIIYLKIVISASTHIFNILLNFIIFKAQSANPNNFFSLVVYITIVLILKWTNWLLVVSFAGFDLHLL